MPESQPNVTLLLSNAVNGDDSARDELFRVVERELRKIAEAYMRREKPGHSLQATILVNDAFIRLIGRDTPIDFQCKTHFYRTAARVMRNMLWDHGNKRRRRVPVIAIDPDNFGQDGPNYDALALDEALEKLRRLDSRQADVVDLHHFVGRTLDDTAELLGVSRTTVKNDWRAARAWLYRELSDDGT